MSGPQVIVIGGGASGMMAAVFAARNGAAVTLLEQNERPGKKLLASGNGKCNLTNLDMDLRHFHGASRERIEAVLSQFDQEETLQFFRQLGLETFARNGWVYPVTEQAQTVHDLLLLELERLHVRCKYSEQVQKVAAEKDRISVSTSGWTYSCEALIIACGSPASQVRGASEDALLFAGQLGVLSTPFLPALVSLRVSSPVCASWAGIRAQAEVSLLQDGVLAAAESGEVQFTMQGISGIPIMQISHLVRPGADVQLRIDLAPQYKRDELAARLRERREAHPERTTEQALIGLLPGKLIPLICREASARQEGDPASALAGAIKSLAVSVAGTGRLTQAQVCAGGVLLSELDDRLACSKAPGIFFCGECVDVHGDCGGYNLQWAWSSGAVAGRAAAGVQS